MLVLVLLKEESMYVYQMQQELKRRSGGTYTISLLYPVLYRLEEQGYVVLSQQQITEDNLSLIHILDDDQQPQHAAIVGFSGCAQLQQSTCLLYTSSQVMWPVAS